MSRGLDGQRWLVTGGTRGLGRELVAAAAREGAFVTACSRTGSPAELPSEVASRVTFAVADVSREGDVERLFDDAVERMGGVDVVVNCAGVAHDALLVSTTLEDWNRVFATNVRGPYLVMRRAVEEFLAAGGGVIVNVASIAANGIVGQGAYAASKSALISMSRAVAKEYAHRNVRCNAVVPGFIDTDMTASLAPDRRAHVEELSPEGRFGTAAEVTETILFLASADASFVTGDDVWVSGAVRDVPRMHRRGGERGA